MCPIRIIAVADEPLVLSGLTAFLSQIPDIEIVGEACCGEAIAPVLALEPDIILLHLHVGDFSNIDWLRAVLARHPKCRALVVSGALSGDIVRASLAAGASGCLSATDLPQVAAAMRAIHGGACGFPAAVLRLLALEDGPERGRQPSRNHLTCCEQRVLSLLAQGKSSKEIAELRHVSSRTVDAHRANIMKKLDIHTATGLVRYAICTGRGESSE